MKASDGRPASAPAGTAPSVRCPVCGEYVGPAGRCGRCGAAIETRLGLRIFRWAAVALSTAGLGLLFLVARHREIPLVAAGAIERTMNFAYVRMAGAAAGDARIYRKGDRVESLRFDLNDGTGEIAVRAYGDRAREIVEQGLAPREGDAVEVAGSLQVTDDGVALRVQSAGQLQVRREELPLTPIAAIGTDAEGRGFRIAGEVVSAQPPRAGSRAPWTVEVRDASGTGRLVFFASVRDELPEPEVLERGALFEARVTASTYRGTLQLQVQRGSDLLRRARERAVPPAAPDREPGPPAPTSASAPESPVRPGPAAALAVPIRDLLPAQTGAVVRVRGRIESVQPPREGSSAPWQVLLREDDAALKLVFWPDVADRLPADAPLRPGETLEAEGRLESYRGNLQLRILRAPDLRRTDGAAPAGGGAAAP